MRTSLAVCLLFLLPLHLLAAESQEAQRSIGLSATDLTDILIANLKPPISNGVLLVDVEEGTSASKAGLRSGDLLTRIDSVAIGNVAALNKWIEATKDGATYQIEIYRPVRGTKSTWFKKVVAVKVVPAAFVVEPAVPSKKEVVAAPDLSELKEWEAGQAKLSAEDRPFEVKGDRLGMTLDMFKAKYHRIVAHWDDPAPWVFGDKALQQVGIVSGRTSFAHEPEEEQATTIAGVRSEPFRYKFIDGHLFEITVVFNRQNYPTVKSALEDKHGPAANKVTMKHQTNDGITFEWEVCSWGNGASEIMVMERLGGPIMDKSYLTFTHRHLKQLAQDREKKLKPASKDDL